jgi:DNA-binding transcriptional ArsR family regulator
MLFIPCWRYHRGMAMDDAECVTAAIAAGVSPAVALFRSLADETRLRIVARLAPGEARVVDLTGELGLAQSTVSKNLACLRGCGLVDYRVEGRQSFYALTRPELMDLLRAAEGVLAATGATAALCPSSGAGIRAARGRAPPSAGGRAGHLRDHLGRGGDRGGCVRVAGPAG